MKNKRMGGIAVFSGTSEGRELSEKLSLSGYYVDVFVATDYGEKVINKNDFLHVNSGRLQERDIVNYLMEVKPAVVFDATHPHAKIITENIKNACEKTNSKYIRVSRELYDVKSFDDLMAANIDYDFCKNNITVVKSIEEAKALLDKWTTTVDIKNIMLTTGVKELSYFADVSYKDRLFARVLPGSESIAITEGLGFKSKNVIAMEGPFSVMMNKALIDQYNVSVLVTKNSGKRGGFIEKIKACYESNTEVIIIEPDNENECGISVDEAIKLAESICINTEYEMTEGVAMHNGSVFGVKEISEPEKIKSLKIVGAGICKEEYLTFKALTSIKEAELIIGAKRMVSFAKTLSKKAEFVVEYTSKNVADIIKKSNYKKIVYLVSGDSGFYSGAKGLADNISCDRDVSIEIIPGISSVSYMASKLGIPYSDMGIYSMHGRDFDINTIKNREENGFFVLCTDYRDVCKITESELPMLFDIYVGKNFGMPDEKIYDCLQDDIDEVSSFTCQSEEYSASLFVVAGVKKIKQEKALEHKNVPLSLMVAATGSGSGKTTFVSGLLALLKDENKDIHAFKCGPDYIDPMFHTSVLKIPSRNLDSFFCDDATLNKVFRDNIGSINVIEAAMGLYDGIGATDKYSAYEIAKKLKVPILLVVDGYGMGYSVAALIKGFLDKDYEGLIKGIILNRVSDKFYSKISKVIASELKIKVFGHLKNNSELNLKSRHLGLMSPDENNFDELITTIKNEIASSVDYREIIKAYTIYNNSIHSCNLEDLHLNDSVQNQMENKTRVKLAVAKDEAFSFIYEDNIELLKSSGADIIYFSPLKDREIPDSDGLILYGGYPENYAKELSNNKSMLESVRAYVNSNKPVIAECGGFMYLLEGIYADNDTFYEMAGAIKGKAARQNGLVRFGYANINIKCHNKEYNLKGHEFHHFDIMDEGTNLEEIYDRASTIEYVSDNRLYNGIVVRDNLIAGYPHLYYLSCREFIKDFVESCK